jgi:glucokinase
MSSGLAWRPSPQVVRSELGGDAGRIGAAILAFRAAGRGQVVQDWTAPSVA